MELKTLKEIYISLWLKGLVVGFLGIGNMYFLVSACYDAMNDQDVSFLTLVNLIVVGFCLNSSLSLKATRHGVLQKIKEHMQGVAKTHKN